MLGEDQARQARPGLGMWGRPAACKADWFVGPSGGVGSPSSFGGEKAAEEPLDVLHWCVKRASFYTYFPRGPFAVCSLSSYIFDAPNRCVKRVRHNGQDSGFQPL